MSHKYKYSLESFPEITPLVLTLMACSPCPCCGERFSGTNLPEMTAKCHKGPVFVGYWDGWIYLSCSNEKCLKPIGRIKIDQGVEL